MQLCCVCVAVAPSGGVRGLWMEHHCHYWVDSFTTLCWTKNKRHWKQYVQHRVNEIRHISEQQSWRHFPGSNNPTDLPSRSIDASDLVNNQLWWHGPTFLQGDSSTWPDLQTTFETEDANKQKFPYNCAFIGISNQA